MVVVDVGGTVIGNPAAHTSNCPVVVSSPELEPVSCSSDLAHLPLPPAGDEVGPDVNVVTPVRSVLSMGQPKDVEQLMGAPDMVHTTTSLTYSSQHQHMGS